MKKLNTSTQGLLAALVLSFGLSACAPVMVGGMVGGVMVASDRRTSGAQVEDEGIEMRSASAIRENFGSNVHANFTSYNRQVLITGEVPTARERQQIEQLIGRVENVRSVVNELAVGPASSIGDRSADALITARVKAAMVDSEDVFASIYKVVTERGTVYLMGRVTQREANRATDIARGVSGVKRVVRVFEYITDAELQALRPKSTTAEPTQPMPVMSGSGMPVTSNVPVATPIK
ncbi:BON domain-containing protein [Limnohabitans sp. JirII-31]|uniref:BON domain-containing protein n=1 Tax=Limnohabitans sp. JirII-31 TaxID=1977908 RepID=UPI000C1DF6FB|nr:BON domain-containing protein [Limnohabitans sp. JirII-31]PIT74630.1 transporter [Limnohabitans sp. JirII-31]